MNGLDVPWRILRRRFSVVAGTLLAMGAVFVMYVGSRPTYFEARGILDFTDPFAALMETFDLPAADVLVYRIRFLREFPPRIYADAAARAGAPAEELARAVAWEEEPHTSRILVSARHDDPERASAFVNAFLASFEALERDEVARSVRLTVAELDRELARLRGTDLAEAERRIEEFSRRHPELRREEVLLADLRRLAESDAVRYEISLDLEDIDAQIARTERRLRDFLAQCDLAIAERKKGLLPEERLEEILIREGLPGPDQMDVLRDPLGPGKEALPVRARMRRMEGDLDLLLGKRAELSAALTDAHPDLQAMDRKIAVYREVLAELRAKAGAEEVLRRRFAEYDRLQRLREQKAALREQLSRRGEMAASIRERLGTISGERLEYLVHLKRVEQIRERIGTLTTRKVDLEMERSWLAGNVGIEEKAFAGRAVRVPRVTARVVGFFAVASILAAGALAYLMETSDASLRAGLDVERRLGVPVLGSVPFLDGERRLWRMGSAAPLGEELGRMVSYLFTRRPGEWPKVYVVASSGEGEGKSTVAANLAVALSRNGCETALVDCDLLKPRQHDLFDAPIDPGLSALEPPGAEAAGWEALLRRVPSAGEGKLALVTAGKPPENPSGLVRGAAFERLFAGLLARFDAVVIDTPPLTASALALAIAPRAEGVVLVVEAGATTADEAVAAVRMIENAGGTVAGCVLNKDREGG